MRTIYKYELPVADAFAIKMKAGARFNILSVQAQGDAPYLWAIVDDQEKDELVRFVIMGTGHPMDKNADRHVGTFQLNDGRFVGHVFTDVRDRP